MQTMSNPTLIKQARYYASTMVGDALSKGHNSAIYIERDRLFKTIKNGEEYITGETQIKFVEDIASDWLSIEHTTKISHLTVDEVKKIISSSTNDSKLD